MDNDKIDEAFRALHDALKCAQLLYMDLRDSGDATGAANAKLRADRIQNEIDNLVSKELTEWQKGAEDLIPQLTQAAANAQKAVEEVENDVRNVQSVVSAMQTLDDAIGVAMKFVG
jgi:hypothetical protein